MIDILSDLDREHQGVMQGSVHILRTVLEWRVAPESPWRKPHPGGLDRQLVLLEDVPDGVELGGGPGWMVRR